ncbi:hypothetical protein K8R42_00075, partial [bacterium]|nr:hypothetical protein [bacterium]
MTSVLALSKIMIDQVKIATNTVSAIGAFYSAESGLEKGLYYLKHARINSDFSKFDSVDPDWLGNDSAVSVGRGSYEFTEATYNSETYTAYDISPTSPAYVDIVDPAGDIGSIIWPDVVSTYLINWTIKDCFPFHASDKLEITLSSFQAGFASSQVDTKVAVCNCSYGNDLCDPNITTYSDMSSDRYYRVSFKPLDGNVQELVFDLKNLAGDSIGIRSKVNITVDGKYKNSKYRLRALTPSLAPISDIFNYIIFSEQSIIKNL